MTPPPPRIARVVLVAPDGAVLGALAPTPVATPYWQDVAPVVEAVRARHGARIVVLRLLEVGEPGPEGLEITYLAQTHDRVAVEPWDGALDEHPLRLAYARPGGPAADLAWARGVLERAGLHQSAPPVQVRSWNLSSLWRIPVEGQSLWLKVVPPFFAHEGTILAALAGGPVPAILGHEGPRILMPEIPGEDLYEARGAALQAMIDLLTALQRQWIGRTDALLAMGLSDWRAPALALAIDQVVARNLQDLTVDDRATMSRLVSGLGGRFAAIGACGIPDTLAHGDAHRGNFRGDGRRLTLLDWGDCGVGHPLLDQPAFLERIDDGDVEACRRHWRELWRAAIPGSDPDRAAQLLAPIAAARQAVVFQGFLDRIEPSEHPYHRADPAERLARAAALFTAEGRGA